MSDIKCPICNSANIKVSLKLESPLGGLWDTYECENCAVQFIYPIPSPEELNQFYDQLYQGGGIERTKLLSDPSAWRSYWRRQWKIIRSLIDNKVSGRVLDIGCGGGHFLDNAGPGWEKYGIELSEEARKVAASKGIKAFATLEDAIFPDEFFDVVTMFAVIEHLPNPKEVVKELTKVLKPRGLFVIMTGDVRSLKAKMKGKKWHMYRPPEHLYFFCARSLDFLMDSVGFRKVKILYTDGGITHVPFRPLNMALRAGLMISERIPVLQSLPLSDHNYSYYKRV
jgi:SAM-dependent methyltransferase